MVDVYRKAEASEGLASRGAVLGVAVRVEGHHLGSSVSMFSIRCTTLCTVQSSWKVMTTLALRKKKSLLVKKKPAHPNNEEEDSAKQWEQKLLKSTRIRIPINYYQFSLNVHQLLSILINYDHFSLIMINFHQLLSIFINYDHFSLIMINFHQLWSIFINYDQGLRLGQIVSVQDPDLDSGEASGKTQWTGNW